MQELNGVNTNTTTSKQLFKVMHFNLPLKSIYLFTLNSLVRRYQLTLNKELVPGKTP